ncbi:NAD(P)/FAD-dependent oxidoreductase [Jhaorihella thermophila]|uniref:Sarcosine oxidase subunit beta n=1 Tax=Jhaorihella thermophila TaxID=488547 RepID=A0A1H5X956_9RHOB|nr:FAD-dependent oxidoreductase [Jhaorihella thermophila]SEG07897.1 sarcosine oxidase subunit beta [Jhaorihella thermophila]
MSQTADAIIIGTGVIGAAVAFELAKKGWKTLSLDRNAQVGHGSTAGSCAIIRMHYSTFDGTAFAWEGYHYWRDWAEYLGLPAGANLARFRQTGCLVMKTPANGMLERHMAFSADLGCPFEEWDAARIVERLPIYSLDSFAPARRLDDPDFGKPNGGRIEGAVFWPLAGYVTDPALSAQNLMDAARAHGARVRTGAAVVEILQSGGRAQGVKLAGGEELHAPVVVNVAGPGSSIVNRMAGVTGDMTIETRPLRQEVVHIPAPDGFDFETRGTIVSDSDIACYCRPEQGNHILVGSEDPECDPHMWVEDDIHFDRNFTAQWTTQAMRYGQRVPGLGIPSRMRGVVDLYDASTDWIPIYDKSSLPGFYMACGTSGNQFKNAPIAGKLMAALIEYCENGTDHDTTPMPFKLPHIGRTIDAGFYSRKRPVNEDSSFSVLG